MKYPYQLMYSTPEKKNVPVPDVTLTADIREAPAGKDTVRVTVSWKNTGCSPLCCRLEIRVKTDFAFTHYVIPAVLYNGNGWGRGKEPKGLSLNGEPWVFDHRRTSVPACTISENSERFFAMFASNSSEASLNASCSMIPCGDGTMLHRLLYPCVEGPRTYCGRDRYREAHEEYISLQPGESFETTAFVIGGANEREFFATVKVENAALDLLCSPFPPRYTPEELQFLCCEFAKRLITEKKGHKLFCIGKALDGDGGYSLREGFEFGWCGQNGMYARLFLQRGFEKNVPELIETGTEILDFWASNAGKTGLAYTNYDGSLTPSDTADTCNLSYVILELTKAYAYLKKRGINRENWLSTAARAADFLISAYDERNGFGKAWNVETGGCADANGTIGAFMIPALCELFNVSKREKYLLFAKKACRFYRDRDLANFMCTAGALDTCCIDKETSGPILAGSIALYEIEKDKEWLECAGMAAGYFCSWMFHHDTLPVPGSDFEKYGYRTMGGTSVSAQHHHIDPWGALIVPQLIKLWKFTGDRHWKQRADLIWANAIQNIAPEEGLLFHGHRRLAGAQNEAYFHCSWGSPAAPGEINEWLVAWPQAFIWNTSLFLADESYVSQ